MNNNLSDTPPRRGHVIARLVGGALLSVVALVLAVGIVAEGVAAFATTKPEGSATHHRATGTEVGTPGHGFHAAKLKGRGALIVGEVRQAAAVATSAASAIDKSRLGSLVSLAGHARKHSQKALTVVHRPPMVPAIRAVFFALAKVGVPYRNRAAGPDSFDCSGLTMAAYQQLGIALPHRASLQARLGAAVDWRTQPLRPGDLIFTRGGRPRHNLGHVGIAVSALEWVVAPNTGRTVTRERIPFDRVQAVRRILVP